MAGPFFVLQDMAKFTFETTGFAALTITELMLQECILKGVFEEEEAKRLLQAAARRHEEAATGSLEKIQMNMEVATLIRSLSAGLEPLFERKRKERKKHRKKRKKQLKKQKMQKTVSE